MNKNFPSNLKIWGVIGLLFAEVISQQDIGPLLTKLLQSCLMDGLFSLQHALIFGHQNSNAKLLYLLWNQIIAPSTILCETVEYL